MKKVFLSITALTFGASVAFAQTNETEVQQNQNSDLQIERLSNSPEEAGKKKIELGELPSAVHEAFKESEFKDWEVQEVYELSAPATEGQEMTSDAGIAPAGEEAAYEIRLISKDMKDEISDSQEAIEDVQEDAAEADEAEEANVSTETVKVEVPAVVLQFDKEGNLIKQDDQNEANETETLEQY